jgi:hypothetical protein
MRYFFHTADGSRDRDETGTEFPDDATARKQAVMFAGEYIADNPDILAGRHDFRVEVTDDHDMLLFTVIALAVVAPAVIQF